MRSIFLLLCTFLVFKTYGQELPPAESGNRSSEIGKMSYLPTEGTAVLSAGYLFSNTKSGINGPAGKVIDTKGTSSILDYIAGYGLSNYLTLGIAGQYYFSNKSDNSYGPGSTLNGTSTSLKSSGIREPEMNAIWRVRDNEQSKLRIHIQGAITPNLQKAKFASASGDGNEAIGGTSFSLGAKIWFSINDRGSQGIC